MLNLFRAIGAIGVRNSAGRAWYKLQKSSGILRLRYPPTSLSSIHLPSKQGTEYQSSSDLDDLWKGCGERFFFHREDRKNIAAWIEQNVPEAREVAQNRLKRIESGQVLFFSKWYADLGATTSFNHDPKGNIDWPVPRHWTTFSQFDPKLGDIKLVWEASRFADCFALARISVLDKDSGADEWIWKRIGAWIEQNPINMSVNWACGQEMTFRLMAWLFAINVVGTAGHEDLGEKVLKIILYSARRIEKNLRNTLRQNNNHGITEALGLYSIGTLFPNFEDSQRWKSLGKRLLIEQGLEQIYADGSYIQHSTNYSRLMLHDYLWALRLGQINGDEFPQQLLDRLKKSTELLHQLMEVKTGRLPNYGYNDGALILPLNDCDFLDYRPVLQAMSYLLSGTRLFEPGPWDEDLVWLFGVDAPDARLNKVEQRKTSAPVGGYYTLRGKQSAAMIRCHSYSDRPAQADMLHLDLWFQEENLLRDTGSFQYYCTPVWQRYFRSSRAHNTVVVDDRDQMEIGSRFLWFNWVKSRLRHNQQLPEVDCDYWEGEHYGYCRDKEVVVHRRAIIRWQDRWLIIDDILGEGKHSATLRWHLPNSDWRSTLPGTICSQDLSARITVQSLTPVEVSFDLMQGSEHPEGWESLYYGEKKPIPVLRCQALKSLLPLRFITTVCFDEHQFELADGLVRLQGHLVAQLNHVALDSDRIAEIAADLSPEC